MTTPDHPPKRDRLVSFARYSEIGFIIPACVLLGLLFGKLADYWLHTHWLYVAGIVFGAVVGFWQMIRMALGAFNDNSDNGANNNANKNE
jgi:F0F1-type ATP synthase assembly protein I